jgi:hypothetical protein
VPDDAGGRPQDQGRRHRKAGQPSAETATLLARYQEAMRDELRALLAELQPRVPDPGLGLVAEEPTRLALKDRAARWDLAIRLGRELGTEVDVPPMDALPAAPPAARRRRGRIDFG